MVGISIFWMERKENKKAKHFSHKYIFIKIMKSLEKFLAKEAYPTTAACNPDKSFKKAFNKKIRSFKQTFNGVLFQG